MKNIVKTTILFRIDETNKLENLYRNNQIEFSCAANWIDYANKQQNNTIGDLFECVFAHLRFNDDCLRNFKDARGNLMKNNLFVLIDRNDNSCYLRYVPTILTPTICFYSLSLNNLIENNNGSTQFRVDLNRYCNQFGLNINKTSIIIILNPTLFIDELNKHIPQQVVGNKNLTDENYYTKFDVDNPIKAGLIDYNKHNHTQFFNDNNNYGSEMFWKDSQYSWQNECRICFQNMNFTQRYSLNGEYQYEKNTLKIFLPNLKEYSKILKIKDINNFYVYKDEKNEKYSSIRLQLN